MKREELEHYYVVREKDLKRLKYIVGEIYNNTGDVRALAALSIIFKISERSKVENSI
jgi:hypothetical protein